jgi:putative tricarboxylic transport membrane protein
MNHKRELGIGVFFLILSGTYLLGSLSISIFDPFGNNTLNSQSIPQLLGVMMAVLSVIHIAGNAFAGKREKAGEITIGRPQRLMLLSVLFIAAYIFLFTRLGFILSSALFLGAEIFLLIPAKKRKTWAVVCFSAGLPVLLYLLFTKALTIFLPRGLIGW